ncbi:MAG: winged helix-turn-helix transcriptional regulator [Brachymonas sp.]
MKRIQPKPRRADLTKLRQSVGTSEAGARAAQLLRPQCSIFRATQWIGDAWSIVILRELFWGSGRFDEMLQNTGMASNVLTARLKKLQDGNIISKQLSATDARRYDYALTSKGQALFPVLMSVMAWGDTFESGDYGPMIELQHTTCGSPTKPGLFCTECGKPLAFDTISRHLAQAYVDHLAFNEIEMQPQVAT